MLQKGIFYENEVVYDLDFERIEIRSTLNKHIFPVGSGLKFKVMIELRLT
jgi:hypothetical protein